MQMKKISIGNFKALHESIMVTSGTPMPVVSREQYRAAASPVVSSGEQNTELTSNLSERSKQVSAPQNQNLSLSQNPVVKCIKPAFTHSRASSPESSS